MVKITSEPEAFARLGNEWNALATRFHTPVLDHQWLTIDRDSFHSDKPFRLVTVRDGERLVAACVLVGWRSGPLLRWELIATDSPGSLVFESTAALTALLAALEDLAEPIVLKGILHDGEVARLVKQGAVGGTLRLFRRADDVFVLPIRGTWEDFIPSLPSRRRKQYRRKRRKAEEMGEMAFRSLQPTPGEAGEALARFFEVEHANWKGAEGWSVLSRSDERAFIERYALAAAERGQLRLFFLEIGGQLAAGQLAVVFADRLWGLKIGYDAAFAKCSPGFLLDWEVLCHAFGQGMEAYEFMGKADAWESFWNPEKRSYRHARLYRFNPLGLAGLVVDAGAMVLRRIGWIRR